MCPMKRNCEKYFEGNTSFYDIIENVGHIYEEVFDE